MQSKNHRAIFTCPTIDGNGKFNILCWDYSTGPVYGITYGNPEKGEWWCRHVLTPRPGNITITYLQNDPKLTACISPINTELAIGAIQQHDKMRGA